MEDEPHIAFGPLKIWIHGRQFPDSRDYWDGNWLSVTARCEGVGSRVEVTGAFLHLGELSKWREEIDRFGGTLQGEVELPTIEPTLKVKFRSAESRNGHIPGEIALTGDHLGERHQFTFETDQSYLPGLLSQVAAVLRDHPIRK